MIWVRASLGGEGHGGRETGGLLHVSMDGTFPGRDRPWKAGAALGRGAGTWYLGAPQEAVASGGGNALAPASHSPGDAGALRGLISALL